jgi:WhiB family redox-sensing transcriptional regulator
VAKRQQFRPLGDWVEEALCREVGSEIFFPPDDKPVARDFYANAKSICNRCSVTVECLEYGLAETYGVWGGTTPSERAAMREHRNIHRIV